ncbi:hypothetical protein SELMODRAFT_410880 [Selaginella moellendorffii]|uniref:AAA+ ATPase domain-containing protein n=1 Tax=Selaginella moellendorffii TaxID=88036 RepID=D8RG59_SELML|nr:hypothetical protein SELMODRAFT_410880 [Selaginella moellendorffii]
MARRILQRVAEAENLFYNRKVELDGLAKLCKRGSMVLITGPPDSGKSVLVSEFARRQEVTGQGHPIYINMRAGTFSTAASFARELKSQMSPFLAAAAEFAKNIPKVGDSKVDAFAGVVGASAGALSAHIQAVERTPDTDLPALLKSIHGLLFSWRTRARRFMPGKDGGFPTLIIDEANRLHEWSLSPEELEHLRTLIAYFIMVTKERQEANVILCTSEDFFKFWLDLCVGAERYQLRVVGDLTEEQAREFFLMAVRDGWGADGYKFPEDLWKKMFSFVGGRTLLLKRLAENLTWYLEDESLLRKAWASECKILADATRLDVEKGFKPMEVQSKWNMEEPGWSVKEYEGVLTELSRAEGGVVSVQYLIDSKVISRVALHSLVQHNFLHYRSSLCPWADDLAWYKGKWPIVMAPSLPRLHAMASIIEERGAGADTGATQ